MDDIATHFLQTAAAGGAVHGACLSGKAPRRRGLDCSPDSPTCLERLPAPVRDPARPGRAELATPRGPDLRALGAYDLLAIVRRLGRVEVVRRDRGSALRALSAGRMAAWQMPALATRKPVLAALSARWGQHDRG